MAIKGGRWRWSEWVPQESGANLTSPIQPPHNSCHLFTTAVFQLASMFIIALDENRLNFLLFIYSCIVRVNTKFIIFVQRDLRSWAWFKTGIRWTNGLFDLRTLQGPYPTERSNSPNIVSQSMTLMIIYYLPKAIKTPKGKINVNFSIVTSTCYELLTSFWH